MFTIMIVDDNEQLQNEIDVYKSQDINTIIMILNLK